MFKYIDVNFPESPASPSTIYSAYIYQNRYEHEVAVLHFHDWGVQYDSVLSGSPAVMKITGSSDSRMFYGYVHHIEVDRTPGEFFTKVVIIGASFVMKQQHQTVYKNITADAVVKKIAKSYGFACSAVPHKRIYPQITQAGHTDWQLLVRLAKQCGYTLRTENTEIYFEPVMYDYTNSRSEAPVFTMRHEGSPAGSTIYSFKPLVGDALPFQDAMKAAVAVNGVDVNTKTHIKNTKQLANLKTKKGKRPEMFDRFDTSVVVTDSSIAKFEAEAAENRNYFPYRAVVEVLGEPNLRPNTPVYLNGIDHMYNGYWVVLSTEHKIVETERFVQTYTTVLHVGTDSLGQADTWIDGSLINSPKSMPTRTLIAGVRQTNIKPGSYLAVVNNNKTPQTSGSLGTITNRVKTGNIGSVWKTSTPELNKVVA